jgi:nucleoside-specific outer membrane channel protein Tsx
MILKLNIKTGSMKIEKGNYYKCIKWNSNEWNGNWFEVNKKYFTDINNFIIDDLGRYLNMDGSEDCFELVVESAEQINKYKVNCKGVMIDVYDVLSAYQVQNPALQHLAKKVLKCGDRGHKNREIDLRDILASAKRALELEGYDIN